MTDINLKLTHFPSSTESYISGGSIRDILLGREPVDYDVAVMKNPKLFAEELASCVNGHVIELGRNDHLLFRVVSEGKTFDVSPVNGNSIEEDLRKRDFTINAMACCSATGTLIDCMDSQKDLYCKTIRMVSEGNLKEDPVRMLRAFRIAACYGFSIDAGTLSAIKDYAALIQNSAGERIRDELMKLMNVSESWGYIRQMAETGLLDAVFPEITRIRGCLQNRHHQYDVFEHTMKALLQLEKLLNETDLFMSQFGGIIGNCLNGAGALLKFAMIFHDIGKPDSQTTGHSGDIHFYAHEKISAEITGDICDRLKFSNRDRHYVDVVIRNHLKPLSLFNADIEKKLSSRSKTRFFMACGACTPDILLHAVADAKAKKEDKKNDAFTEFAKNLLQEYVSVFMPMKSKPPLITGKDLVEHFGLSPSPFFKIILSHVEEARLTHRIQSREDAFELIERFLKNR